LIGRFDLTHHRFVGVFAGKQSGDRGQHGKDRGAERDPGNPFFAAVLGAVMDFLMQMFQRDFGLFHDVHSKIDIFRFKMESTRTRLAINCSR
jgi:hypothetical protein